MRSTKSDREVLKRVTSTSLHWSKCHLVRGSLVSSTPSDLIPLAALPIPFVHVFLARRRIMRSDYSCTSIVEFESYFPRIFSHGYWIAISLCPISRMSRPVTKDTLLKKKTFTWYGRPCSATSCPSPSCASHFSECLFGTYRLYLVSARGQA